MKSSIQDVAQLAHVSISTVSRSFTRPDLVSKATRDKVMKAADELKLLHFTFRSRAENRSRATHRGPGFRTAQPVVQLIHHRRPQPDLPRRGIRHFHLPDVEHRGTS